VNPQMIHIGFGEGDELLLAAVLLLHNLQSLGATMTENKMCFRKYSK